jgi:hypothetical protein
VHLALRPLHVLTARYVADDYFYYLNVARHLAAGAGSTFDGLTITNGYQPLFLLMLAAVFRVGAGKGTGVHAGLLILAAASAASAWLAYRLLARHGRPWGGALAAGLLSLGVFFVLPALTGFETALALATSLYALDLWDRRAAPARVGLALGLAFLARVDAVVLAGVLGVLALRTSGWKRASQMAAAFAVVVAPWVVWSTVRFGTPLPESGAVKMAVRGGRAFVEAIPTLAAAAPAAIVPMDWFEVGTTPPLVLGLAALVLGVLAWEGARRLRAAGLFALLLALVYVVATEARGGELVRYLAPAWMVLVLLVCAGRYAQEPLVVGCLLCVQLRAAVFFVRWDLLVAPTLTYVGVSQTAAPWAIRATTSEADRIAAFDAGSLGYFSDRPVTNLDGLMNHDIVVLRRRCGSDMSECLREYIRRERITVIAGGTGFGWTRTLPEWSSWERLHESPLGDGSSLVLLRVPRAASAAASTP